DLILDAFSKIGVGFLFAQILEREYRDRFFWRSQARSYAITGKHYDASDDHRESEQRCRRRHPAQTRAFLQGFESLRQLRIAELIVIEIHDRDAHSMLYFARTEIVQEWSPPLVFFQILSDVLRKQNVPGVATIHHPFSHIDSSAREIGPFSNIDDGANWPAVNSHPKSLPTMFPERATDLHRTLHRGFRTRVKYQRHAIPGADLD